MRGVDTEPSAAGIFRIVRDAALSPWKSARYHRAKTSFREKRDVRFLDFLASNVDDFWLGRWFARSLLKYALRATETGWLPVAEPYFDRLVEAVWPVPESAASWAFERRTRDLAVLEFLCWDGPLPIPDGLVEWLVEASQFDPEALVLAANIAPTSTERAVRLDQFLLRACVRAAGLALDRSSSCGVPFRFAPAPHRVGGPLLSIVMAARNAASTIDKTMRSLRGQTYREFEILVVDDGSTDETGAIVRAHAARDARVRLIDLPQSRGAYPARNVGLSAARGTYIGFHDADDISDPVRFERQVAILEASPRSAASLTGLMRVTPTGKVRPRVDGRYVHRNFSSLVMRRAVRDRLGWFDHVRVGADSEYLGRIQSVFGPGSVTELHEPLTLALLRPDSLTQSGDSWIGIATMAPSRKGYMEAFQAWHATTDPSDLFVPATMRRRPFPVDPALALPAASG